MNAPPNRPSRAAVFVQRSIRWLREIPLFGWYVCKRYWHDHCFQSAAAMSYNFLFAAIPMIAVGLAILAAFPVFDQIRLGFQDFILQYLLPQAGEEFRTALDEFLRNTRNLTAFGILALAITAIILLDTIETVFNRIWRQSQVRPLVARVTMYWAILTFARSMPSTLQWLCHWETIPRPSLRTTPSLRAPPRSNGSKLCILAPRACRDQTLTRDRAHGRLRSCADRRDSC